MSFWRWFFGGKGRRPGLLNYFDRWLVLHVGVGLALAFGSPACLAQAATASLLPLAAVFIGLSFGWGANALVLLQTSEIETLAERTDEGLPAYAYAYLSAILAILVALVLWGVAALGFFDKVWPTRGSAIVYTTTEVLLYGMISVAFRECWSVVQSGQLLLLARRVIGRVESRKTSDRDG